MHKPSILWTTVMGAVLFASTASGQRLDGARAETYKTIGDVKLKIHIFNPPNHQPSDRRAAIVFFFGGGWSGGNPQQFANHCRYLASQGMVAMAADYRVYSRQMATVNQCVADAKSAIRWARANAPRLGIDPGRIAAGGGSAGGHLAAAIGTLDGFDEAGEDTSISARPNAMALFNPALDLTREGFGATFDSDRYVELSSRFGVKAADLSPNFHVRPGTPPAIVFHGTGDTTVPFAQAERFTELMKRQGNRCELAGYEGASHGFFNFGRGEGAERNKAFLATVTQLHRFLASLGYLAGEPTIEEFVQSLD